jgi:polyhydroxyalkanoate synthesis regulator phasin
MTIDRGLIDRIRARGEEVFSQLSGELMSNPRFMKAMEGALRGREKVEEAVTLALKQMNVPTRTELKRALGRIEALERELAGLRVELRRKATAEKAARTKRRTARARVSAKTAGAKAGSGQSA